MSAELHPRPPLGLPAGSIRGLLSLQIAIIFWLLLIIPTTEPPTLIPLNLYFLLSLVMVFFVSHGKSIARRAEKQPSPLWLPGGSIRLLLLAGTVAVFADLIVRHPDRLDRLTPNPDQMKFWIYFLGALAAGFFVGYATRILPFKQAWGFQSFQAWLAILAMAVLFLETIFQVVINVSLTDRLDAVTWQSIVTGIVAFYFGSRS